MDCSIVIPMHDEEEALPALELAIEAWAGARARPAPQIVLVDDGSRDRTAELASGWRDRSALEIVLARRPARGGLGRALRTGFAAARGAAVVTYDADRAYPIADVDRLLDALSAGHDVATASPYRPDAGVEDVPAFRLVPSRTVNALYRLRFGRGRRIPSAYTCGFRAFDRAFLARLPSRRDGFLVTAELMVLALRAHGRVAEIPSVLRTRREGRSKMKVARTALQHLGLLLRGA